MYASLVHEYNVIQTAGIIDELSIKKYICEITNSEEWLLYYFSEYPVLLSAIEKFIANISNSIVVMLDRINNDRNKLSYTFKINIFKIKEIDIFLGDSHKESQTTSKITFSNGEIIYYKPRPLDCEVKFYEYYNNLIKLGFPSSLGTIKLLSMSNYGYAEHIDFTPCSNINEVENYYYRQGLNLALFYILSTTDLIHENIIAFKNIPFFIDLECLFNPERKSLKMDYLSYSKAGTLLNNSVFQTEFIPKYSVSVKADEVGISLSGLSDINNKKGHNIVVGIRQDGSMYREVESVVLESIDNNIPTFKNKKQAAINYLDKIIDGFENGYKFFFKHKTDILNLLDVFKNVNYRILLRPTATYSILLDESQKPKYLTSKFLQNKLLQHLYRIEDKSAFPHKVITNEKMQFLNGDIPFYSSFFDSVDLYDGKLQMVKKNFFKVTARKTLEKKINNLSLQDLKRQIDIIYLSFLVHEKYSFQKAIYTSNFKHCKADNFSPTLFLSEAENIAEILIERMHGSKYDFSIMDITIGKDNTWIYGVKNFGTFDGIEGIGMFFLYLYKITDKPKYRQISDNVYHSSRKFTINAISKFESTEIGITSFFHSPMSFFYYTLHYDKVLNTNYSQEYASQIHKWINNQYIHEDDSDIIMGSAGAVVLLINYYETTLNADFLDLAFKVGDNLVRKASLNSDYALWNGAKFKGLTGFSHGTSGFIYAFSLLYKYSKKETYKKVITKALKYETLLKTDLGWLREPIHKGVPLQIDFAWAYGAGGIALSRILLTKVGFGDFKDEINFSESLLFKALENTPTHSLSDGLFGVIDILSQIADFNNDTNKIKAIQKITANLVMNKKKDEVWATMLSENSYQLSGLFTGLAGIGLSILKQGFYASIPSPLNFTL